MSAPNFWEVLNRGINTGVPTNVREFDMKIFTETSRLVKDYDIKHEPGVYVPDDDSLADDVWKAGLERFLLMGMYCMDSRRVIMFDDSEVKSTLSQGQAGCGTLVGREGNQVCPAQKKSGTSLMLPRGPWEIPLVETR